VDGIVLLVGLAMAVGIVGTVVPLLPGLLLVWAAGLAYGVVEGFGTTGVAAFTLMTAIAVAGAAAGWLLPQRAAARAGAARSSMLVATVGAVVGFFVIPVVGLPVGAVAGLYVAELRRTDDPELAWRATRATLVSFGLATVIQFLAGLAMALVWVAWVVVA
jgi:uncharacterized protein YqgC (DUF456 family)